MVWLLAEMVGWGRGLMRLRMKFDGCTGWAWVRCNCSFGMVWCWLGMA
jgi:hypothetical protein